MCRAKYEGFKHVPSWAFILRSSNEKSNADFAPHMKIDIVSGKQKMTKIIEIYNVCPLICIILLTSYFLKVYMTNVTFLRINIFWRGVLLKRFKFIDKDHLKYKYIYINSSHLCSHRGIPGSSLRAHLLSTFNSWQLTTVICLLCTDHFLAHPLFPLHHHHHQTTP